MLNGLRQRWQRFGSPLNLARDEWVAACARSLPAGARVLDVGAGPARYRPLFAHCEYLTQDFAQHVGFTEGPLAEGDQWRYGTLDIVSDAAAIPVGDASFDAVLCTEVLEHTAEPDRVVREIARIVRPGGRVFLSAPLGSGLHQEPHHFFGGFTPYWYQRVLGEWGFTTIEVIPNGGFFMHFAQESHRFATWLSPWNRPLPEVVLTVPFWLIAWPWHRLVVPIACRLLDHRDARGTFTVGYHVTAIRATSSPNA